MEELGLELCTTHILAGNTGRNTVHLQMHAGIQCGIRDKRTSHILSGELETELVTSTTLNNLPRQIMYRISERINERKLFLAPRIQYGIRYIHS